MCRTLDPGAKIFGLGTDSVGSRASEFGPGAGMFILVANGFGSGDSKFSPCPRNTWFAAL